MYGTVARESESYLVALSTSEIHQGVTVNIRSIATRSVAALATVAALGMLSPARAAYVFSLLGSPNPATVGDIVTVELQVSGDSAAADGLNSLGFNLGYNTSVLSLQTASATGLTGAWFFDYFDMAGSINVLMNDLLLDDAFGPGTLATFTFTAFRAGTSALTLDAGTLFVDSLTALLDSRPVADFTVDNSSVVVQNAVTNGVPLPGTALLAGLGLVLLGWQRRPRSAGLAR
jgi:hypothetical protein